MSAETLQVAALVVQTASVVVGVGASVVALRIAAGNRRSNLRQAHLMFELDAAVRLAENLTRGGTATGADPAVLERERLGAEAFAMAGALGPGRLPSYWAHKFTSEELLRSSLALPEDDWRREAAEAQLAVMAILRDIEAEEARGPRRRAGDAPRRAARGS